MENEESQELELYENYRFTVDRGQESMRMDKYLQMRIEGVSRTKVQAAAKAGCVLVNGKAAKSNYKIKPLDTISVLLPTPPREIEIIPEDIPFNIVYEDDDVLVVDKEAGPASATSRALCSTLSLSISKTRRTVRVTLLSLTLYIVLTRTPLVCC